MVPACKMAFLFLSPDPRPPHAPEQSVFLPNKAAHKPALCEETQVVGAAAFILPTLEFASRAG
jgi:hypothetical protein